MFSSGCGLLLPCLATFPNSRGRARFARGNPFESTRRRDAGLRCRAERCRNNGHGPRHTRYVECGCLRSCLSMPLQSVPSPVDRIPTGDLIRHIFCSIRPLLSHGRKRGSRRPPSRCLRSSGESNDGRQTGLRCRGQRSRWYGHGPRHPRWVKHGRLGICCLSLPL